MVKDFDRLTITDDFMFCKVMQNEGLCKELLEMILTDKIGKITALAAQYSIATHEQAKSVRFDIAVQNEKGTFYDIEMQVADTHNLAKRMRFYQAAIDISFLDKGYSYKKMSDSFIIFICLFDMIGKNKPVYTFENICVEDKSICLQDGTKKIILNANAFNETDDKDLSGFLKYVKTGIVTTDFTGRIENMIQAVKNSEQARQEYQIMSAAMMDEREKGAHQKALETARILKQLGDSITKIMQVTGLSKAEVEAIGN